jgi:carboxypeptidase Q
VRASMIGLLILGSCRPANPPSKPPVVHATSVTDAPATSMGQPSGRPSVVHDGPLLPTREPKLGLVPTAEDFPPALRTAADKLSAAAQTRRRGYERLVALADKFGHRLSGSQALERAIDWSLERMREDKLVNVRREKVMVPHWVRGPSGRGSAPIQRELVVLGLGGTVGTKGTLRGEIAVVSSLAEIASKGAALQGQDRGHQSGDAGVRPRAPETGYRDTVPIRVSGGERGGEGRREGGADPLGDGVEPAHAAHRAMRYAEGVAKIPAAAVTLEDAELLARLAAQGKPTTVELSLGARTLPDSESGNAIAELRGRELPDEVVVIGGHIDSWDVGDGSSDDGSRLRDGDGRGGDAARSSGWSRGGRSAWSCSPTRRTACAAARRTTRPTARRSTRRRSRSDSGGGAPPGFGVGGTPEQAAEIQRYGPLFAALGADKLSVGGGGADIGPLAQDGVIGLGLHPDNSLYFDLHHSPADTIDKIDPANLAATRRRWR